MLSWQARIEQKLLGEGNDTPNDGFEKVQLLDVNSLINPFPTRFKAWLRFWTHG